MKLLLILAFALVAVSTAVEYTKQTKNGPVSVTGSNSIHNTLLLTPQCQ